MARIQIRRATGAEWTLNDPILAEGELGVNLTTNQVKVGNGTSSWTELPSLGGSDGGVGVTAAPYHDVSGWPSRPLPSGEGVVMWTGGTVTPPGAEPGIDFWVRTTSLEDVLPGTVITQYIDGTTWPFRPTNRSDVTVLWIGGAEDNPPPSLPETSNVDMWIRSALT